MDEDMLGGIRQMQTMYEDTPLYLHVHPDTARLMDREARKRRLHLTVIAEPALQAGHLLISPVRDYKSRPA